MTGIMNRRDALTTIGACGLTAPQIVFKAEEKEGPSTESVQVILNTVLIKGDVVQTTFPEGFGDAEIYLSKPEGVETFSNFARRCGKDSKIYTKFISKDTTNISIVNFGLNRINLKNVITIVKSEIISIDFSIPVTYVGLTN